MNVHRRSVSVVLLVIALLASVTVVSAQGNSSLSATVNNFLNVRALPDIKSYDYGRLEAATEVTLIGRTADSEWVKLTTAEGTIGWARENAVTTEGDVADLPVLSIGTDQAVVLRFVTLRANQGIDSGSETRLEQGAMVTLLATDGEWLYVQAEDGATGWVSPRGLAFVRARGADEASQPELPEVNASVDGFANVRALPEMTAYNYERLDPGTPVSLIGRSGNSEWVQVETMDGLVAWGTTRAFKYDGAIEDLPAMTYADNQGVVTRFAVLRTAPELDLRPGGRAERRDRGRPAALDREPRVRPGRRRDRLDRCQRPGLLRWDAAGHAGRQRGRDRHHRRQLSQLARRTQRRCRPAGLGRCG